MTSMLRKILTTGLLVLLPAACDLNHDPRAATRQNFRHALEDTLAERGDICLAMFDWPLELTPAEAGAGTRHAVQLPVFEKLGLATSTVVDVPKTADNPQGVVKRYALTGEGRKYYKPHPYTSRDGAGHARDFCVAHVRLERIVGWQLDTHDAAHPAAVVSYTYEIDPAPWLQDADARRVLPMVARAIEGAGGRLQLRQGFTLGEQGWVASSGPV
ncbi:hypothetical protein [Solimonas soli]|uniref:hypothetical protein n=1 Tax=Solimonas soli TaxID=413479 RepID=UPI0004B75B18|nr:hypothetical protein [Solimonas soli]